MHVRGTTRGMSDKGENKEGGADRKGQNRGNIKGSDRREGQGTVGGNDGK